MRGRVFVITPNPCDKGVNDYVTPQYKATIEHSFDAFCKKAMRFEARNCYKEINRKQQREVSLDYLMEEYRFSSKSTDDYFIVQPTQNVPTNFFINGQVITVQNEHLATALLHLPMEKQELILLHYFLGFKTQDIAALQGCTHSTISYRKHRTLQLLREEMEMLEHERV